MAQAGIMEPNMKRALGNVPMLLIAGCLAACAASLAHATIQEESCIEPDVEYPVPCDED
jgi:hypothetical protein